MPKREEENVEFDIYFPLEYYFNFLQNKIPVNAIANKKNKED